MLPEIETVKRVLGFVILRNESFYIARSLASNGTRSLVSPEIAGRLVET